MSIQNEQHRNFFIFLRPFGEVLRIKLKNPAEGRQAEKVDSALRDLPDSKLRAIGLRRELQVFRGRKGQVGLGRDAIADSVLWQARSHEM